MNKYFDEISEVGTEVQESFKVLNEINGSFLEKLAAQQMDRVKKYAEQVPDYYNTFASAKDYKDVVAVQSSMAEAFVANWRETLDLTNALVVDTKKDLDALVEKNVASTMERTAAYSKMAV